jgi:hypothetical protein
MKRPNDCKAANLCRFDKASRQNLGRNCSSAGSRHLKKRQLLMAQKMLSVEISLQEFKSVGILASNLSVMESLT